MTQPVPEATPSPTLFRRGWDLIRRMKAVLLGAGARSGYLSAADQSIISVTNFAASLMLARQVNVTEFGVYGVGFTLVSLVEAFQEGLIIQPLNTFGAALGLEDFRRYASLSLLLQVGLIGLASLLAALIGWVLFATGNVVAGRTILALSWVGATWQLQKFLRRMFYTRGQLRVAITNTVLTSTVRIVALVWLGNHTVVTGITGLNAIAIGTLTGTLLGLWHGRRYWTWRFPAVREIIVRDFKFGRWVTGGTVSNWMTLQFYPVLVAWLTSFASAGAYRAIQNLVAPVHLLLYATDTFLVPRTAKQFVDIGRESLDRTINLIYIFIGIPVIGLLILVSIFAVPLLRLLYGETYVAYAKGVPLMALFYFLWYLYWPLQIGFKAIRQTRPIFIANLLAIFSMLTIGIALIYRWDVYGTLAGQILSALIVAIILGFAWWRLTLKSQDFGT